MAGADKENPELALLDHDNDGSPDRLAALPRWRLEEAKARLSEVVKRARSEGPQRVTRRGKDAVVVLAADDYLRLTAHDPSRPSLVAFLRASGLGDIDATRELDRGREVEL